MRLLAQASWSNASRSLSLSPSLPTATLVPGVRIVRVRYSFGILLDSHTSARLHRAPLFSIQLTHTPAASGHTQATLYVTLTPPSPPTHPHLFPRSTLAV